MIAVPASPFMSRPERMAPTWPSIIALGATMSAPAWAYARAASASSGSVASLSTRSPSRTPQWPCVVYSQRQTSAISTMGSPSDLSMRSVSGTGPLGFHAPRPSGSFSSGIPNRRTPPTPAFVSSCARATARSGLKRAWPFRDAISCLRPRPEITKIGATRPAGSSRVSRTSERRASLDRSRRGRSGPGTAAVPTCGRKSSRITCLLQWNRTGHGGRERLRGLLGRLGNDFEAALACGERRPRPDRYGGNVRAPAEGHISADGRTRGEDHRLDVGRVHRRAQDRRRINRPLERTVRRELVDHGAAPAEDRRQFGARRGRPDKRDTPAAHVRQPRAQRSSVRGGRDVGDLHATRPKGDRGRLPDGRESGPRWKLPDRADALGTRDYDPLVARQRARIEGDR